MLLKETFNYKIGYLKRGNKNMRIAYIDKNTSENTYKFKDTIKSYGAKWDNMLGWWWDLGENPKQVIDNQVAPCVEFLTKEETNQDGQKRQAINIVNELISQIKSSSMPIVKGAKSKEEILNNLESFKADLIKITSDEEFKRMFEPIIRFRNANGYQYSLLNSILIMMQDSEATMVKSRKDWAAVNRQVVPNTPRIMLWFPVGSRAYSKEEQEEVRQAFLKQKQVQSEKDLTPGDKEILRKKLNKTRPDHFDLGPYWTDVRFTEQIPDTEDLVGAPPSSIPWFDGDSEETEDTVNKVNALLQVIQKYGINIEYTNSLGGARGVSKSGTIGLLADAPKNAGTLNTIIHEFAHELLHQKYLKSKNPDLIQYFVDVQEGRSVVEQQAELCAWIVMRGFGYDMKTNINYVTIWGLNEKNAVTVFDTVSRVAHLIAKEIYDAENNIETMYESRQFIVEYNIPSGYEIAQMCGFGKLYRKSALRQKQLNQEKTLNEVVKRTVSRILREQTLH